MPDDILEKQASASCLCEATVQQSTECRCACGSLLARVVPSGVELKCRRCKRVLILPLSQS